MDSYLFLGSWIESHMDKKHGYTSFSSSKSQLCRFCHSLNWRFLNIQQRKSKHSRSSVSVCVCVFVLIKLGVLCMLKKSATIFQYKELNFGTKYLILAVFFSALTQVLYPSVCSENSSTSLSKHVEYKWTPLACLYFTPSYLCFVKLVVSVVEHVIFCSNLNQFTRR